MVLTLIALVCVLAHDGLSGGKLRSYLVVPLALIGLQYVGMRWYGLGPTWIHGHVRDIGLATVFASSLGLLLALFKWARVQHDLSKAEMADLLTRYFPRACAVMTAIWVAMEIVQSTVLRPAMIAKGYSGKPDVLDFAAYILGLAIIIVNHKVMAPRIQKVPIS